MAGLQSFRQYLISQNRDGGTVELWRSADEVACLAVDTERRVFVELHVAIAPQERQRSIVPYQRLLRMAIPLRHRNLPVIHEGGEDDGAAYYVSDVLAGERMESWLNRCAPLPEWLALQVAEQIAAGLRILARHPSLLAGVNLDGAGLTMTGDHREDLSVKLCDLGMMVESGIRQGPREMEARLILESGSLLQRMLTGPDGDDSRIAMTAEVTFLVDSICRTDAPHHPRTVEQLYLLLARGRRELAGGNIIPPERIPPRFLPEVPLRAHFPTPATVQDAVGDDYTVDPNSGDAARPWQLHAIRRSTRQPVTVQLLPPPNLVPGDYFAPAIDAAVQMLSDDSRYPIKLLEWHPDAGVVIEERAGPWNAASLVRRRGGLRIHEVLEVLERLEDALSAAEEAGLETAWRDPSEIRIVFDGEGSGSAGIRDRDDPDGPELPPFTVKLRTWPVSSWLVQPGLRSGAHLTMPGSEETAMTADAGSEGHDFAVLAAWLAGGAGQLPDAMRPLFLEWTGRHAPEGSRSAFLDDFRTRVQRFDDAGTEEDDAIEDDPGWSRSFPEDLPDGGGWESDEGDDREAGGSPGFAEALFGSAGGRPVEVIAPEPAFRADPRQEEFAANPFAQRRPSTLPEGVEDPYSDPPPAGGRWVLWLMVVLIAAIIGGIAAQLSGLAFWQ